MGQISTFVVRYPESTDLKFITFSYLPGCDLFHKIAVTCKSIRNLLPKSGLLDQVKIVTVKTPKRYYPSPLPVESFKYALRLSTAIQIQVNGFHLEYVQIMFNMMQFA